MIRPISGVVALDPASGPISAAQFREFAEEVGGFDISASGTRVDFRTQLSFNNWNPFDGLSGATMEVVWDEAGRQSLRVALDYSRRFWIGVLISGCVLTAAMPLVAMFVTIASGVRIPALAAIPAGPVIAVVLALPFAPINALMLRHLAMTRIRRHFDETSGVEGHRAE